VEDTPPVAALKLPSDLRTLALLAFDGSASSDPDAELGDAVEVYRWTFTSAGAPCDPPTVAGSAASAKVRFACAGRFAVQLVVVDALAKDSEPVTQEFEVAEGASLVSVGPDQVVNHHCGGEPVVCTTEGGDPVVTATVSVPPVGTFHYAWTALAPSGPLGTDRRVTFPSAPAANAVAVRIETGPGTFVKDDWPVQVAVSDDAGPLGTATTRISVGNRAPTATTAAAVSVNHTYSAGSYRAIAPGAQFTDPDGDPLTPGGTGSTTCTSFSLAPDGTAQIACQKPFAGALGLTGFVAAHSVSQQVTDPWGEASPLRTTAVTILNRAAAAESSTQRAQQSCSEGACCSWDQEPGQPRTCIASHVTCEAGAVGLKPGVSDPDGDPVQLAWSSGLLGAGSAVFELGAYPGTYAVPAGSGCGMTPTGSAAGTFTASDGLSPGAQATLTVTWGG
jgi:hypothetical protein